MRNPFTKSKAIEESEAPKQEQRFLVTSAGDLVSQAQFRSHIEKRLQGVAVSGMSAGDALLAAGVALSVPALVCIRYHSNVTSTIPIEAVDHLGNKSVYVPMRGMLDNRMRWLISNVDRSLLIWGKAFIRKHYNSAKVPTLLEFIHPLNIRVNTDSKQNITDYRLLREQETLLLKEVIYIPDFDYSDTGNPLSKLENAFPYISLERGIVVHGSSFFYNGASIAGIVTITTKSSMSEDEFEQFQKDFRRQFSGAGNSFKVAIFENAETVYTPLSAAPADLAMTELSDQSKQFVCAAFGVNPALVGLGDVSDPLSALSTLHETKRNFVEMEATPSLDYILDQMNSQWALTDFGTAIMLKSDSSAMAMMNDGISADDSGVTNSLVASTMWTFEEGRENIGYDPFPEDDFYISRDPVHANGLYDDGTISLNQKLKMLNLPLVIKDTIKIDGVTYLSTDREQVAQLHLKQLEVAAEPAPALPFQSEPLSLPSGVDTGPPPDIPSNPMQRHNQDDFIIVEGVARQLAPRLVIAADLSNHQLIKLARRELGRALADHKNIEWIADDNWRVEFAHVDRWSPSDVINMSRMIKWDNNFNRAEVWTDGYFVENGSVYLRLATTEQTQDISSLIRTDLSSISIDSIDASPVLSIRLCSGDVETGALPVDTTLGAMPIVITKLAAFANNKAQHKWRLRTYYDTANKEILHKQRDELTIWQQRRARSSSMEILHLPEHVVRYVSGDEYEFDIKDLPEDGALVAYYRQRGQLTISELFENARRMLSVRALQALRLDWENFVEALITDTRAGKVKDRARFGVILRGEMGRFARRAYLDGLTDGGILDATLSDDDNAKIKTMLSEQSGNVSSISEILFKGDGLTDAQADGKPRQWWAGSVLPFYQEGFKSAGVNPMMEFVGPFGKDPCLTCKHLFGQKHRFNVWKRNGLGMVGGSFVGQNTICGKGGHCKHQIVTVIARASGSIRTDDMSEEVRLRLDEIMAVYQTSLASEDNEVIADG